VIIGVLAASFAIGGTLLLMNKGLERYTPVVIPIQITQLPRACGWKRKRTCTPEELRAGQFAGFQRSADGKYLYDPGTQRIEIQWIQGIGVKGRPRRRHA